MNKTQNAMMLISVLNFKQLPRATNNNVTTGPTQTRMKPIHQHTTIRNTIKSFKLLKVFSTFIALMRNEFRVYLMLTGHRSP